MKNKCPNCNNRLRESDYNNLHKFYNHQSFRCDNCNSLFDKEDLLKPVFKFENQELIYNELLNLSNEEYIIPMGMGVFDILRKAVEFHNFFIISPKFMQTTKNSRNIRYFKEKYLTLINNEKIIFYGYNKKRIQTMLNEISLPSSIKDKLIFIYNN